MFTKLKNAFLALPPLLQLFITAAVITAVIWISISLFGLLQRKSAVWSDNAQDKTLQAEVNKLEIQKKENQEVIDALKADNVNLKIEIARLDTENRSIKQAIANDGRVVQDEQDKIDAAVEQYKEGKDSCAANTNPDAYVQCVCAKLGVACNQ